MIHKLQNKVTTKMNIHCLIFTIGNITDFDHYGHRKFSFKQLFLLCGIEVIMEGKLFAKRSRFCYSLTLASVVIWFSSKMELLNPFKGMSSTKWNCLYFRKKFFGYILLRHGLGESSYNWISFLLVLVRLLTDENCSVTVNSLVFCFILV